MNAQPLDDDRTLDILGTRGRDAGKVFHLLEIDPLTLSGFVLRLVAALRVPDYDALIARFMPFVVAQKAGEDATAPIDAVMQLLQGADPHAVHALISELLDFVRISPDPAHPNVRRALQRDDIRELQTLGAVLMGHVKLNFTFGG
jgi:hypothetical protein